MPWSSCQLGPAGATDWACVAFYHLYEIPFAALFAYHAYLGFTHTRRSPGAMLPVYTVLSIFQLVMLVVFLTFESKTLLDGLAHHVPLWEQIVVYGGCVGILVHAMLGFYIVFTRLVPACLEPRG